MTWARGKHMDAEVAVLEVYIRRDVHGRILSAHQPASDADAQVLLGWPSGGLEQAAFALLAEAVRREALMDVLLQDSHQPEWRNATEGERQTTIDRIERAVRTSMADVIDRITSTAVRTAVDTTAP